MSRACTNRKRIARFITHSITHFNVHSHKITIGYHTIHDNLINHGNNELYLIATIMNPATIKLNYDKDKHITTNSITT